MIPNPYKRIDSAYDRFYLTWIINNICTNHCSYCPEYLHRGQNHNYQWRDAQQFIQQLLEHHPRVHLIVSGGEPTVSPFLPDLLREFAGPEHFVGVSSNGVRSADYWAGLGVDSLNLSYHPSAHTDSWLDRARDCRQHVGQVVVNCMMDPQHWDLAVEQYYRTLEQTELDCQPIQLQDWGAQQIPYTHEQLEWLANAASRITAQQSAPEITATDDQGLQQAVDPEQLVRLGQNQFSNWSCDIGLHSAFVQFDGSWRRANCEQGSYLGWIKEGYHPCTQPVRCGYSHCICTTDVKIPKRILNQPIWRIHS